VRVFWCIASRQIMLRRTATNGIILGEYIKGTEIGRTDNISQLYFVCLDHHYPGLYYVLSGSLLLDALFVDMQNKSCLHASPQSVSGVSFRSVVQDLAELKAFSME
jgi:hypothetical protein